MYGGGQSFILHHGGGPKVEHWNQWGGGGGPKNAKFMKIPPPQLINNDRSQQ